VLEGDKKGGQQILDPLDSSPRFFTPTHPMLPSKLLTALEQVVQLVAPQAVSGQHHVNAECE